MTQATRNSIVGIVSRIAADRLEPAKVQIEAAEILLAMDAANGLTDQTEVARADQAILESVRRLLWK